MEAERGGEREPDSVVGKALGVPNSPQKGWEGAS